MGRESGRGGCCVCIQACVNTVADIITCTLSSDIVEIIIILFFCSLGFLKRRSRCPAASVLFNSLIDRNIDRSIVNRINLRLCIDLGHT